MLWKVEVNVKVGNHIVPYRGIIESTDNAFTATTEFIESLGLDENVICTRLTTVPLSRGVYYLGNPLLNR